MTTSTARRLARRSTTSRRSGLNEYGATCSPPIEVVTQPAQSPDLNINDLAFFRALGCAVRKLRTGTRSFCKEKLVADVKQAWGD